MLAAQAIHQHLPLLGNHERLEIFGVRREW